MSLALGYWDRQGVPEALAAFLSFPAFLLAPWASRWLPLGSLCASAFALTSLCARPFCRAECHPVGFLRLLSPTRPTGWVTAPGLNPSLLKSKSSLEKENIK